ncbi:MAG: translation initiation factor IF-2 subunit gamma [Candidatus Asgardarchaeia archaeon]
MPKSKDDKKHLQPEVNIGVIGHVDHGKTTLVQALSGIWTDRHSEELKRGISIKLGYADTVFRKCPNCPPPQCYTVKEVCPHCGSKTEILRRVSFVDAPGHEVLLATMLSGAALMDGAILVIAANEPCPQPQTREHLEALLIAGTKNIVIAQNKIELVSDDKVMENYQQIRNFIKNTVVANAPIIPISAIFGANIDVLIQAIEEFIPTPKRDLSKPVRMYVARSFDVNKPGTPPEGLVGGVVGGSILWGQLKLGDEVEIRPGIKITQMGKTRYEPLYSEVVSLKTSLGTALEVAKPGGLIGVGTKLDPSLTKADALAGSVLGIPGTLPETLYSLNIEVHLMERVVGLRGPSKPVKISLNDHLLLNVGTAVTLGAVTELKKDMVSVSLRKPVCVEFDSRVAISKKIEGRWRLIGYGFIRE